MKPHYPVGASHRFQYFQARVRCLFVSKIATMDEQVHHEIIQFFGNFFILPIFSIFLLHFLSLFD